MERNKNLKSMLMVLSIACYIPLILPWYTMETGAGGYSMTGTTLFGFSVAASSFLGYALYIIPAFAVGILYKINDSDVSVRVKCFAVCLLSIGGGFCTLMANMFMKGTEIDGGSFYGRWNTQFGFVASLFLYIGTAIIALIVTSLAVETVENNEGETTDNTTTEVPTDSVMWECPKCNNSNPNTSRFCNNCGTKNSVVNEQNRSAGKNEWECPKCGKIHQNYVGTCGCGEGKPV